MGSPSEHTEYGTTIVTLTMNPALDVTTSADHVGPTNKIPCRGVHYDDGRRWHQRGPDRPCARRVGVGGVPRGRAHPRSGDQWRTSRKCGSNAVADAVKGELEEMRDMLEKN